jgi:hypothetical protein
MIFGIIAHHPGKYGMIDFELADEGISAYDNYISTYIQLN